MMATPMAKAVTVTAAQLQPQEPPLMVMRRWRRR